MIVWKLTATGAGPGTVSYTHLYEEIQTLTASRRFEQKIMNLLPFLIILYVDLTSPGFFDQMYTTVVGRIVMSGCLAIYGAAYWISGKILDITVS